MTFIKNRNRQPNHNYNVREDVYVLEILYKCNTAHTSGATFIDTNWDLVTSIDPFVALMNIPDYGWVQDAGTFNGIACDAASNGILYDRRLFMGFSGAVNDSEAGSILCKLPGNYLAGRDIKIKFYYTYNSASAGNVNMGVGLTYNQTNFTGDTDTIYQSVGVAVPANTDWKINIAEFIFNGTGLAPGDIMKFIFLRDKESGHGDDLSSTVYVGGMGVAMEL